MCIRDRVMRPDAPQFCAVIVKSCEVLKQLMAEFHNFKKSGELIKLVIDINSYENEGDKLYIDAMRELYTSGAVSYTHLDVYKRQARPPFLSPVPQSADGCVFPFESSFLVLSQLQNNIVGNRVCRFLRLPL